MEHQANPPNRLLPEDVGRSKEFGAAQEGHLELALPAPSLGVAQGEQQQQQQLQKTRQDLSAFGSSSSSSHHCYARLCASALLATIGEISLN